MTSDDQPAGANNPAGRLLAFLRPFGEAAAAFPDQSAALVAAEVLGVEADERETVRTYLRLTQLREQAEAIPELMSPFEFRTGYKSIFKHYAQIIQAMKLAQVPAGQRAADIVAGVTDGGWSALEFADELLSSDTHAEPMLTAKQSEDYLAQIRQVKDAVAGDVRLEGRFRRRIVDLLQKVERALLDCKVNGSLPVQEAAAAAGAIVSMSPSMIEKVREKPYARDLFTVLYAIVVALQAGDSSIAIGEWVAKALGGG